MRKKILSCVLAATMVTSFVPSAGFAEVAQNGAADNDVTLAAASVGSTFTVDGITYTVTSETEVSVGAQKVAGENFASTADSVVVPSQVQGYTVTGINAYAFSNGSDAAASLSSITLPDTIKTIGNYAFHGCANLKEVTIPSSVTSMGMYCFANCTALENVTFADCDADGAKLAMDEGAFFVGAKLTGALKSITLPKRLMYVPSKAFQNQGSLTSVKYASGTTMSRIGSYAFYKCTSLAYLEIPSLTAEPQTISGAWGGTGTTTTYAVGTAAFQGCSDLSEIVFLGDEKDWDLSSTSFITFETPNVVSYVTYYYPPVKTVVYYGDHKESIFTEDQFDTNHYQRISYFASKADAEAGTNVVGEIFVRDDVALKDIESAAGQTDDKGALVYSGSVPTAPKGSSWYYGGDSLESGATHHICAYPTASTDLSSGQLVMDQSEFTYNAQSVTISAKVLDAAGTTVDSSEYTLSVTDASGKSVSLSKVKSVGTYTLTATANASSSYTGSVSTTFTINAPECNVTRSSGNAQYSTLNHETDSAFAQGSVDTVILVGRSSLAAGAAAAGLAGVRQAPIMVTDDGALTLEAKRTLNYYKPKSVILVGITDSATVTSAIQSTLGSTVTVSNGFTADTQALTSYNLYYKTKSAGYWKSATTVYVASCEDVAGAALAGSYAYRTKSPVFLTEEDGTLPDNTIKAIKSGGFTNVVFVGDIASKSTTIAAALKAGGYTGLTRNLSASNDYALSVAVAKDEISADVCGYNNVTLVSPADEESAVIAAATCGQNEAPLLYVDNDNDTAVEQVVEPNLYDVTQAYVFGVRGYISGEFQNAFERLWGAKSANDLKWATVTASYTASESETEPVVTVTASDGKSLVEGTDFYVAYYSNATDKRTLASNIVTGDYTAVVTGTGDYTGTNCASFAATAIKATASTNTVKVGALAKFVCTSNASSNAKYQWQFSKDGGKTWSNNTNSTATKATMNLYAKTYRLSYLYRCKVTDGEAVSYTDSVKFDAVSVKVTTTAVTTGKMASLKCTTDATNPTYKWQYRTSATGSWKNSTFKTKNESTLKLYATTARLGYQYRCCVTTSSGAKIYSDPISLKVK